MFTSQPSLVIESGVHSSLHANCHRQITFAKFNLNAIYPPPYEREVALQTSEFRLYSTLNCQFLLGKAFHNVDVNKKVMLFNNTVLNIIRNFIPHETVTFDDREPS